jgi:phytoene dehydrogenase-like protein
VLERSPSLGGAAVSRRVFEGVDARLSCYSYLVSLFPASLRRTLGLDLALRTRSVASYTPCDDDGLLVSSDAAVSAASFARLGADFEAFRSFYAGLRALAPVVADSLLRPLATAPAMRAATPDEALWGALVERPLSELLEERFAADVVRGVVLTDALIGTFAPADDPDLRQNRCFLYHVIGDGTGLWKVPIGGMGAVSEGLATLAAGVGVEMHTGADVVAVDSDGHSAEVRCADGSRHRCAHVAAGVAPAVLAALQGAPVPAADRPEGSQLKLNLVLKRLPRLRDACVDARVAFAGTFHVNEGYAQLQRAYEEAAADAIPSLPPCEAYCHSLTDPTILGPSLREAGAQTLTVFALHMPARLFAADHDTRKAQAVAATLRSFDAVLAEPLADCLFETADGTPCLEAHTPVELEQELGMPGGHIFHRDLSWPFAESDSDVGRWGVETELPNVWLCGAGARRGGGVSGIPGHNAAQAVIETCRAPRSRPHISR